MGYRSMNHENQVDVAMTPLIDSSPEGARGAASESSAPMARVHALLADAAAHFRSALRSSPKTISYLRERGISGTVAAHFGIGYAIAGWHGLTPVLCKYDTSAILSSGLQVVKDGADARRFDLFRDRVMFPIRDRSGDIVGFGGRVLDGSQPKYLNSPESDCFKKRTLLYGLFEAQEAIAEQQQVLVVEGYLDVVTVVQGGFLPVVATLGTACSKHHIAELVSLAKQVIFCFDDDAAGHAAAANALESVLPFANGTHEFRFLFLPEGNDPDSYVRSHGIEAFRDLLNGAASMMEFLQDELLKGCDLRYAEGRALCTSRAKVVWNTLPQGVHRDALVAFCEGITQFSSDELLAIWAGDF
jgi:DNA primase